jgi:hypothetical protein
MLSPAVAMTWGRSNRTPRVVGLACRMEDRRTPCAPPTSMTLRNPEKSKTRTSSPRDEQCAPWRRQERDARVAQKPRAGSLARHVARCRRLHFPDADQRADAATVVAGCSVYPDGALGSIDCPPTQHHRSTMGLSRVLWRSEGLSPCSALSRHRRCRHAVRRRSMAVFGLRRYRNRSRSDPFRNPPRRSCLQVCF